MANIKIYKSRPMHFCPSSQRFRYISVSHFLPKKEGQIYFFFILAKMRRLVTEVTDRHTHTHLYTPTHTYTETAKTMAIGEITDLPKNTLLKQPII